MKKIICIVALFAVVGTGYLSYVTVGADMSAANASAQIASDAR